MAVTTIGRWLHLPASGGADDRFRPDQPLGAGLMQIASSNATHGSRENGMRTLWEHPGQVDIRGDLAFGTDPVAAFPWDAYPSSTTPLVLFAGVHRVRPWGETGQWPRAVLSCQLASDGSSTAGVILVGRPTMGRPGPGDLAAFGTSASGTPSALDVAIAVIDGSVRRREVAPVTRFAMSGAALPPDESGLAGEMAFYVGVWNRGAGKSLIGSLTLYLAAP